VVEALAPVQARFAELSADPAELERIIDRGADKARAMAAPTLARAYAAIGLRPPLG
jgi:tryptophanyl-tRNA synthetase